MEKTHSDRRARSRDIGSFSEVTYATQSLKRSTTLSAVDNSFNTTAVMIHNRRGIVLLHTFRIESVIAASIFKKTKDLIRRIFRGFFVRAFGLMTLAHVGRFLPRSVQSGKRYDAQVIWPNQQPPLSRQVRWYCSCPPQRLFSSARRRFASRSIGLCVELFPACCPEPGRAVHPQTRIWQPLPF